MRRDAQNEVMGFNLSWLEEMYEKYRQNPISVDPSWRVYFDSLAIPLQVEMPIREEVGSDERIFCLIRQYRKYGHLVAEVNPIAAEPPPIPPQLDLRFSGFSEEDLEKLFPTAGLLAEEKAPLREILSSLHRTYCGKKGIEYVDRHSLFLERWIQETIEPNHFSISLSIDDKQKIIEQLNRSELLETFIHKKYTGQKRFSLEGAETLIPMLSALIDYGAENGVEEFVFGMPHRGRLNVLANILDKSYSDIFAEFDEKAMPDSWEGSGDVKYHKGFSATVTSSGGKSVRITLPPNPSHLESVDPVVEGQARAKQESRGDSVGKNKIIPILIHGDAALSGQGVVYETLQFYRFPHYTTGGTLHFVVNNQIGFTTLPSEGRSTHYCTDIAKTFGAPVFHVNAEDPEGCVYVTQLALMIRQEFGCDVFIELHCWRKYGHNESDEPSFTQPLEYKTIKRKRPIREHYLDAVVQEGIVERLMVEELEKEFEEALQHALHQSKIRQEKHPAPIFSKEQEKASFNSSKQVLEKRF